MPKQVGVGYLLCVSRFLFLQVLIYLQPYSMWQDRSSAIKPRVSLQFSTRCRVDYSIKQGIHVLLHVLLLITDIGISREIKLQVENRKHLQFPLLKLLLDFVFRLEY